MLVRVQSNDWAIIMVFKWSTHCKGRVVPLSHTASRSSYSSAQEYNLYWTFRGKGCNKALASAFKSSTIMYTPAKPASMTPNAPACLKWEGKFSLMSFISYLMAVRSSLIPLVSCCRKFLIAASLLYSSSGEAPILEWGLLCIDLLYWRTVWLASLLSLHISVNLERRKTLPIVVLPLHRPIKPEWLYQNKWLSISSIWCLAVTWNANQTGVHITVVTVCSPVKICSLSLSKSNAEWSHAFSLRLTQLDA